MGEGTGVLAFLGILFKTTTKHELWPRVDLVLRSGTEQDPGRENMVSST